MRTSHRRTLEVQSVDRYRRRVVPTAPAPRLLPAARLYPRMGWLPTSLITHDVMPSEARLPMKYFLPYYASSKVGWTAYGKAQINPRLPWYPELGWNDFFPGPAPGWGAPTDDDAFTSLRLQGSNPFLLRRSDADLAQYEVDFDPYFKGVFPATLARFRLADHGLVPESISIADAAGTTVVHVPGSPGWDNAKRIVNGLDVRYSIFIRHLLNVHLMVGQAYALAAYSLPVWHPLRPFMSFFTYGTLAVNDAAYKALLTPSSYFLRSNFVAADDARTMVENAMEQFDFREWVWPLDREQRNLAAIPDHPYVQDADDVWDAFMTMIDRHLGDLGLTDEEIRNDQDLAQWFRTFSAVLPGDEPWPELRTRGELAQVMGALLWNNVIHELCGNTSPIMNSRNPDDLATVNFEHLRALATDGVAPQPMAADVFLMDQATYTGRFNVAGNNLLEIPAARFIDDPRLREAVIDLQTDLRRVESELRERNASRAIPFHNMEPSKYEASISF